MAKGPAEIDTRKYRVEEAASYLRASAAKLGEDESILDADVVGAINILSRGMQLLRGEGRDTTDASVGMLADCLPASARMACGSNRVSGRKQEPTETTTCGAIYA
jgi:hypothetical protein